jgi:hypothetical protein
MEVMHSFSVLTSRPSARANWPSTSWGREGEDWAALHNLLVRQSIWIMQEIRCAPKVILVLGMATLDWAIVARLLDNENLQDAYHGPFGHRESHEYRVTDTFKVVQTIEHQREAVRKIGTPRHESRLIDVLARFRNANATDPRDRSMDC